MVLKVFFVIFCLLMPFLVYANVIINEIAWMGSEIGWRDEWIELRNMTDQDIDLSGWVIENASKNHGSLEIPQDGKHTILSNGYYLISYYSKVDNLLEPKTALDIIVDWRVKGMEDISLANNYKDNGQLKLRDNQGTLIDQTPSSDDDNWPAGDNKIKQTMERTISGNWQNSQKPNGTPKAKNSVGVATESPLSPPEEPSTQSIPRTETKTPPEPETQTIEKQEEPTPIIYPSGILINEVTPSPQGPDKENEWLELKNTNDKEVNLSNWKILDTIGSTKTYVFPNNTKIKANGYLVITRPVSKITLNNDGDKLELLNPNGEIVDSITFGKAFLGQSYNRIDSGWTWSVTLTPGETNIITQPSKATQTKTSKNETKQLAESPLVNQTNEENKIISLNETSTPQLNIFLIAFIVALFCSIAFLIIKSNLKAFWY